MYVRAFSSSEREGREQKLAGDATRGLSSESQNANEGTKDIDYAISKADVEDEQRFEPRDGP